METQILRAKSAGFCMGVGLALRKLDQVLEQNKRNSVYTFGPIIHNPQVLQQYMAKGVIIVEELEHVPENSVVVIRAHGIPRYIQETLQKRNINLLDATCPKVKKAQLLIHQSTELASSKKDTISNLLLFGEAKHPEVRGLLSYSLVDSIVFENLQSLTEKHLDPNLFYILASQTTQDRREFENIKNSLHSFGNIKMTVLDTICDATAQRQAEALEIAVQTDHMIVVGGFESGNTRRIVQSIKKKGIPCLHIETAEELPLEHLKAKKKIGLTAGASTPKEMIDNVHSTLLKINII